MNQKVVLNIGDLKYFILGFFKDISSFMRIKKVKLFIFALIFINVYLGYHLIFGYNGYITYKSLLQKKNQYTIKYQKNDKILRSYKNKINPVSGELIDDDQINQIIKENSPYANKNERLIVFIRK